MCGLWLTAVPGEDAHATVTYAVTDPPSATIFVPARDVRRLAPDNAGSLLVTRSGRVLRIRASRAEVAAALERGGQPRRSRWPHPHATELRLPAA